MTTGCEFYGDALVDRETGRLDAATARRLEQHLAGCEECRAALAVVRTVRQQPVSVPDGLEDRVRAAVRIAAGAPRRAGREDAGSTERPGALRRRTLASSPSRWGPRWAWGLPLAAAAVLALLWLGGGESAAPAGETATVAEAVQPFGAWPAADGAVAGELLLSELTEEELEQLLEEMES